MRAVGIVGGLGPESTIDYYRRIIQLWRDADPASYPSIIIDSLDVDLGIRLVTNDHQGLTKYLLSSLERLSGAGCDFAVLAANTPHIVFDALARESPLPLVSIVVVCAQEAARRGYRRVGLLGTGFTMAATFYPDVFSQHGIEVVIPNERDRSWLHERYLGELLLGSFRQETRTRIEQMISQMRDNHQIEAIVLAGTELPLLLASNTVASLPVLDTTELHVRAIVERLRRAAE